MKLYDVLKRDSEFKDKIAAPFFSVPAAGSRSILYVGQATAKDGCGDETGIEDGMEERIKERCKCTKEFMKGIAQTPQYNSAFWRFARDVNRIAATKWKSQSTDLLLHIIWTNISKIGKKKGNPTGQLKQMQRKLAVETLREEISIYKPEIIIFVTANYEWDAVKEVFGDSNDDSWDQKQNEEYIWFRQATDKLPAVLSLGHPQWKPKEMCDEWLNKVSEILPH
ncbi:MAG: hypothetical protein ACRD52_13370 [Candidatus Acidiferrales bacterium]